MEARNHFKNGAKPKSFMSRKTTYLKTQIIMKTDEQKNAKDENNLKYIIYIGLVFLFTWLLKWLMVGILSIFEGGYSDLRSQLLGMCGNAWWGGMNMSNYFLKPTPGDCDGITVTFWTGSPILLGISLFLVLQVRNRIKGIKLGFKRSFNILLIYFAIIAIVVTGRYLAGFSPKNAYWFWPDGVILGINAFILVVRGYVEKK